MDHGRSGSSRRSRCRDFLAGVRGGDMGDMWRSPSEGRVIRQLEKRARRCDWVARGVGSVVETGALSVVVRLIQHGLTRSLKSQVIAQATDCAAIAAHARDLTQLETLPM